MDNTLSLINICIWLKKSDLFNKTLTIAAKIRKIGVIKNCLIIQSFDSDVNLKLQIAK